ncbi:hypothetical protein AOLI_G00083760 [Acnodon oligacanthus]
MLGPRVCFGKLQCSQKASSLGSVEERPLLVSKQLHPSHPGWRLGTASAVHCGGFRYTEEAASRSPAGSTRDVVTGGLENSKRTTHFGLLLLIFFSMPNVMAN